VWVKRLGRVLESAAGIRIAKQERTAQGQPYTAERISSADPATGVGISATSAAQLQDGTAASEDMQPANIAGEQMQLHSYSTHDQGECSSVADVAEIPASQDRSKKELRAEAEDSAVLSLVSAHLGAVLVCPERTRQPRS